MKIILNKNTVPLLEGEYMEYHDGRDGYPFVLDTSIVVATKERAEEVKETLTSSYGYSRFKMEPIQLLNVEDKYEVLFSISDFAPFIIVPISSNHC